MLPTTLDELQQTLRESGPAAAIDRLCSRLREDKDYRSLFYALLMKRRQELGVSPIPTGPAADLPTSAHAPYEEAIREAGRHVGRLYLDEGNIGEAWFYFRMLGEPEPVARALADHVPTEDEDLQPLVHLAFYEGLAPKKGFDWILGRYGICNAITTLGSQELPHTPEVKQYCIARLVRALYAELRERLLADIERQEGKMPPHDADRPTVRELITGRETLFADGFAHIDVSHLSSVVQMSAQLEAGPELEPDARAVCLRRADPEAVPVQLRPARSTTCTAITASSCRSWRATAWRRGWRTSGPRRTMPTRKRSALTRRRCWSTCCCGWAGRRRPWRWRGGT